MRNTRDRTGDQEGNNPSEEESVDEAYEDGIGLGADAEAMAADDFGIH